MKIKLFTHTDLDGIGCAVVAFHAYGELNVDVEYCNYDVIDEKVRDFTASMQFISYDKVYITDISVSKDVADLIEYSVTEKKEYLNKYQLIDHHATAKWLMDEYKWAYVDDKEESIYPQEEHMKSSGTSLLYNYLWNNCNINVPYLLDFIEEVRRYDTWEWNTKFNDDHAKKLNDLLYIIGREKFIERFMESGDIRFDAGEKMILDIEQTKIDKYIENKKKQMFEDELDGYKVGVVFNEQYHSQLGNELAKANEHLDFIVMINVGNNTVSYRGIHKHIDLGKIAGKYGGGGHPQAAGSRTSEDIKLGGWMDFVVNYAQ